MNRPAREISAVCEREARTILQTVAIGLLLAWAPAAFGEGPAKPKLIVDFKSTENIKLSTIQATTAMTQYAGKPALQITTEAAAPWPGVLIEPRKGKWDLSGFEGIEMDVYNPQDVSVRVLLSVNNPGADGRNHCNTESVNVPRRGHATLVLPFGNWHGDLGHPIDLKNIVSLQVMLDRAGRSHRFMVNNIRAVRFDRAEMKEVFDDPFYKQLKPAFGRGINLANALEAPKEGDWGVVLKEEYFDRIKSAGFDSLRLPVRWSAHAEASPPYRIDRKFFDRVDWAIDQALRRRITPIVNMHNYDELVQQPDKHRDRFVALWRQIAEHYRGYPRALAFELFNEPNANLTADKWNRLLAETIEVVRRTNPTREIVVGPIGWNGIKDLNSLELPESDRRLVVTVHYYNPFHFTHQGASWVGPDSQQWLGTKWTGTPQEERDVQRDFDAAIAWAVKHRRPIWLGEFGAYSKADLDSRARWTRFVAAEALRRKMGFAYWEFCSGFGIYDPERHRWIEPLKEALLPSGK